MSLRSIVFSSFVLFSAPLIADVNYETVEILDTKTVGSISIIPQNQPKNKPHFDQKNQLKRLKTQPGELFSQTVFDQDLKALSEDYDEVEPVITEKEGKINVVLKVWLRPTISAINWSGNEKFKVKTLRKELGIKAGQPLNKEALFKGVNNLRDFYLKKGYFESDIETSTDYDSETNQVVLNIKIIEGRTGKIEKIELVGFSKDEERMLRQMLYTKSYNLFISWFLGTGIYNEEMIEQDQQNVINFLQNRGYADARVKIKVLDAATAGKVYIKIEADKGDIYHFGRVSFEGNAVLDDASLNRVFVARPNTIYSPENLRTSAQEISDLYGQQGYIDANIQYETTPRENEKVYDVHYTIKEGKQYRVGLIHILGNVYTQEKVILRECAIVPGDLFDSVRLKATQQRLENIGYFKNVNVYAVKTSDREDEENNYRDVHIEVKEGMTGNAGLFFGFSSSENVFGGLDIGENNFNISGIPRIFKDGLASVRGAGQYAHIKVNVGERQRNYSISWMDPYFYDSLWRFGFDLVKNTNDVASKDYTNDTYGFTIFSSYPVTSYWTYGMKYRFRNEFTKANHHSAPNPATQPTPEKVRKAREEDYELKNHGLLSSFGFSMTYDSTFTVGKPRRGLRSVYEAEYVGLGGKFNFGKFGWTNTLYNSLWSHGIMKYRLDFRFIAPVLRSSKPYEIPVPERFFLGGETTVRGYEPFVLGPRYENQSGKTKDHDPRGGISSSLISIEYDQEVNRFLDLFVFADAGSVSLKRFDIPTYRMSYGGGARIQLMGQMPIMLGWGIPVNALKGQKNSSNGFFFSMGGQF